MQTLSKEERFEKYKKEHPSVDFSVHIPVQRNDGRGEKYLRGTKNIKVPSNFQGRERVRELVRIRDNHSCRNCGAKKKEGGKRLDVHHLNGLCGKRSRGYDRVSEIDGLITLCHKCHFNHPEHSQKLSI